jgi:hypothetical protein
MKRLAIEPRTPAWYAARAESWTASTAAVLVVRENAELLKSCAAAKGITLDIEPLLDVGIDSFFEHTLWTEWASKTGRIPRLQENEHMLRGRENEEQVMCLFESKQLVMVEREVTALSGVDEWLLASFDGLAPQSSDPTVVAPNGFPVEAKCPAFQSRRKLWEAKKTGKLAIMGLPYYWCQVQHQILVADSPYGWFVAAGMEENKDTKAMELVFPVWEKVPRDERFLRAYQAAAKFYHETYIYNLEEPPQLASDRRMLDLMAERAAIDKALAEDNTEEAVDLYLAALAAENDAQERRKLLEARVLEAAKKARAEGSDVVLLADRLEISYSKPPTTSWQKIAQALAFKAGMSEVPKDVIDAHTKASSERTKVKELV